MKENGALMALALSMILALSVPGQSQQQEVFLIDQRTNPGFLLKEIPQAPPELEGSVYMNEEWREAVMILKNGKEIPGIYVRYDLLNETFEVRFEEVLRWVGPDVFQEVKIYEDPLTKAQYSSYETFRNYDRSKRGIAKTLYTDDAMRIIERPYVEVKEPTYVPTHHVGNRNKQVLQKSALYLYRQGKLMPFKRTKKSLSELTGMDIKDLKRLVKAEQIDLNVDDDLIRLLQASI